MYTPPSGPIRLRAYGVEKTLVDCFRHRRKLGMVPLLEALKDDINERRLNVDELWQQAPRPAPALERGRHRNPKT